MTPRKQTSSPQPSPPCPSRTGQWRRGRSFGLGAFTRGGGELAPQPVLLTPGYFHFAPTGLLGQDNRPRLLTSESKGKGLKHRFAKPVYGESRVPSINGCVNRRLSGSEQWFPKPLLSRRSDSEEGITLTRWGSVLSKK